MNVSNVPASEFYKNIDVDYTPESIKNLFRYYANIKYGKKSTTELTTKEMTELYEEVNRHTSKHGVHVPWPSQESLINYAE